MKWKDWQLLVVWLWFDQYRSLSRLMIILPGIQAIRLTEDSIPSHAIIADRVELVCNYDMEGDKLYSVKWWEILLLFSLIFGTTYISTHAVIDHILPTWMMDDIQWIFCVFNWMWHLYEQVQERSGVLQIHSHWHTRHHCLPLPWHLCWCRPPILFL